MERQALNVLLVTSNTALSDRIRHFLSVSTEGPISVRAFSEADEAIISSKQYHYDALLVSMDEEFEHRMHLIRSAHDCEGLSPAIIALVDHHRLDLQRLTLQAGASDTLSPQQLSSNQLEHIIRSNVYQKNEEYRVVTQANIDPLTGIYNRNYFKTKLNESLATAKRADQTLAVLLVNINEFHTVNQKAGYEIGDDTLVQVAERLKNSIRETDIIARLKNDEFAIIATQLNRAEDAGILAEGILQTCQVAVDFEQADIVLTASIGVSLFPYDAITATKLMEMADQALTHAKQQAGASYQYANYQINANSSLRMQLSTDINQALQQDEFVLHYQPIVCPEEHKITAVEALLRWNHPVHGLLKPSAFIGLAQASGLIDAIGSWVIETAIKQQQRWQAMGLPLMPMTVNVFSSQCDQQQLVFTLENLEQQGYDISTLNLEFSEQDIFSSNRMMKDALDELHDLGVHISVDHFGSDYFSIQQLHSLPIDSIKIDLNLIRDIQFDSNSSHVTKAILNLTESMGIEAIAHGVESPDCYQHLSRLNCHQMQGNYISQPMEVDQLPVWVRGYSSSYNQNAFF